MDATEMLTRDHEKVRELFRKFNGGGGVTGLVRRATGGVSTRERQSALNGVCRELDVHTRLEERVFYPAVRKLDERDLNAQVQEALKEHGKVKSQVGRLRGTTIDASNESEVSALMQQLEKDVEHHASEEENEMFPRLRDLMSDQERARLGREMQAMKSGRAPAARRRTKSAASRRRSAGTAKTKAKRTGKGRGRAKQTRSGRAKASTAGKRRGRARTTGRARSRSKSSAQGRASSQRGRRR